MPIATKNKNLTRIELLETGWRMLVGALGPESAQEFIYSFPKKRSNNSVFYWKDFWGAKTVDEIYKTVKNSSRSGSKKS